MALKKGVFRYFALSLCGIILMLAFNNCEKPQQLEAASTSSSTTSTTLASVQTFTESQSPTGLMTAASFTNKTSVLLDLTANHANQIYVTNTSDCSTGGAWEDFSFQKSWNILNLNQSNTVYVKFKNSHSESGCESVTYLHDNIKPTLSLVTGPSGTIAGSTATVEFSGADAGSGILKYECVFTGQARSECSSPLNLTAITNGNKTLVIEAFDNAGNKSPPLVISWIQNALVPISSGPEVLFSASPEPAVGNLQDVVFAFHAVGNSVVLSSVECTMDGSPYQPCANPETKIYSGLSVGSHTFKVRMTDTLSNQTERHFNFSVVNEGKKIIQEQPLNQTEILFVVANTSSMSSEHQALGLAIGNLTTHLTGIDYRIGFTTTGSLCNGQNQNIYANTCVSDMNYDGTNSPEPANKDLLFKQKVQDGLLLANHQDSTKYWYSMDTLNLNTNLAQSLMLGEKGHWAQQSIKSTARMLERALLSDSINQHNKAFVRANASLHIISITDEAEGGTTIRSRGSYLQGLINKNWINKKMFFHTIKDPAADNVCSYNVPCILGALQSLQTLTGATDGQIKSNDYSTILDDIGHQIKNSVKQIQLQCTPVDKDNNGSPDVTATLVSGPSLPAFTVSGNILTFASAPAAAVARFQYECPY